MASNTVSSGRVIPTGEGINSPGVDPSAQRAPLTSQEAQQMNRAGLGGNEQNPGWRGDTSIGGADPTLKNQTVSSWLPFATAGAREFPEAPIDPKLTNPNYVAKNLYEQNLQQQHFDKQAQTDLRNWIYSTKMPGEDQTAYDQRDLGLRSIAMGTVIKRGEIIAHGYELKPQGIKEVTVKDSNGNDVRVAVSVPAKPPSSSTGPNGGSTPPVSGGSANRAEQFNQAIANYDSVRTTAAAATAVKKLDSSIGSLQKQIASDELRLANEKAREAAQEGRVGQLTREQEEKIRQSIINNRKTLLVSVAELQKSLDKLNTDLTQAIKSIHGAMAIERDVEKRTGGHGALTQEQESRLVKEISLLTAQQKATLDLTSKQLITQAERLKSLYETEKLYSKRNQGVITPEESERLKAAEMQLRSEADYGVRRQQALNQFSSINGELGWKPLAPAERKQKEQELLKLKGTIETIDKARTKSIQTRRSSGSTTVIASSGRIPAPADQQVAVAPDPTTVNEA
jgi:hypothetical protein